MADQPDLARPFVLAVLTRLNVFLEKMLAWIAGLSLGALLAVVFVDVVFRQIINEPLLWPSEVAVLLFLWSVLSGASVAARRRGHFVIDLIPAGRWPRFETAIGYLVIAVSMLFAAVVFYYGYQMALLGMRRFTPMTGFPMIYHFTAFPVAGACLVLFALEHLLEALSGTRPQTSHLAPLPPTGGSA